MNKTASIVLFHYTFSPYARKLHTFLTLCPGIHFLSSQQPPTPPRPVLASLGITYRRVPLLAIGSTIYCDSALILATLERLFPESASTAFSPVPSAEVEKWRRWGDVLFISQVPALPPSLPLMQNPQFRQDRERYLGSALSMDPDDVAARRPAAMERLKTAFAEIEEVMSRNSYSWIAGTQKPSLADIHAVFCLEWLWKLPGGLQGADVHEAAFPKTWEWVKRWAAAVGKVRRGEELGGDEVLKLVLRNETQEDICGEKVEVLPVDTGREGVQKGWLVRRSQGTVEIWVRAPKAGDAEEQKGCRFVLPETGYEVNITSSERL